MFFKMRKVGVALLVSILIPVLLLFLSCTQNQSETTQNAEETQPVEAQKELEQSEQENIETARSET